MRSSRRRPTRPSTRPRANRASPMRSMRPGPASCRRGCRDGRAYHPSLDRLRFSWRQAYALCRDGSGGAARRLRGLETCRRARRETGALRGLFHFTGRGETTWPALRAPSSPRRDAAAARGRASKASRPLSIRPRRGAAGPVLSRRTLDRRPCTGSPSWTGKTALDTADTAWAACSARRDDAGHQQAAQGNTPCS